MLMSTLGSLFNRNGGDSNNNNNVDEGNAIDEGRDAAPSNQSPPIPTITQYSPGTSSVQSSNSVAETAIPPPEAALQIQQTFTPPAAAAAVTAADAAAAPDPTAASAAAAAAVTAADTAAAPNPTAASAAVPTAPTAAASSIAAPTLSLTGNAESKQPANSSSEDSDSLPQFEQPARLAPESVGTVTDIINKISLAPLSTEVQDSLELHVPVTPKDYENRTPPSPDKRSCGYLAVLLKKNPPFLVKALHYLGYATRKDLNTALVATRIEIDKLSGEIKLNAPYQTHDLIQEFLLKNFLRPKFEGVDPTRPLIDGKPLRSEDIYILRHFFCIPQTYRHIDDNTNPSTDIVFPHWVLGIYRA